MTTRKPKAEQRRRDLCDAAIALLAADGARGLTHLRVDRHAGFADGTTSFYYQTRAALLRGAMDRVIELDIADFTSALNATEDGEVDSLLSTLAAQAVRTAVEPERSRARARFELMMIASRDPELGKVFDGLMDQFVAISEAAVAQVQPAGTTPDPELIKEAGIRRGHISRRIPLPAGLRLNRFGQRQEPGKISALGDRRCGG